MTLAPSPPETSRRTGLGVLQRLIPFLTPYKRTVAIIAVALTVAGIAVLSIVGGLRYVIDRGFATGSAELLDQTLLYLLVTITVLAAATYTRYTHVALLGERVIADLRRAVYAHVLTLDAAFFESARSGDILSRLSADSTILQSLIGTSISMALRNCVLLIGGILMMLLTSPRLTIFVLVGIPIVVVPIIGLGRRVRILSKANQDRHADINAYAEETIYGIHTLQAFGNEGTSRTTFNTLIESAMQAAQKHISVRGMLTAIVIFLVFSAIGVILWIGGLDVLNHSITAGQLSAFVGYSAIAASSTGAISEVVGDLHRAAGAAEHIFELLDVRPTITTPATPQKLPTAKGALVFDHVTFHYPSRPDTPALNDVSFTIQPGERIAIVGPSGAGKTTLFQLALRFFDPHSGVVRLDGIDIRTADPHDVRMRTGIVPQDTVIFSASARDNIAYGRIDATETDIIAAARAAHADEFIRAMPQGYDTYLGEKGVRISGGQKQRIAVARAILRNPSLLLLDEATSALDAENERLVQDALEKLMQGRTTLIVAHRLATVMNADRILVMDKGQIVASGTHQSLIDEGGLYARLATLQFQAGQ